MLKTANRPTKPLLKRASDEPGSRRSLPLTKPAHQGFASRTLTFGMTGSLLLWAAFPPVNWAWLAWIAPLPWLWLALMPTLPGRRPYIALWLAGTIHWLAMLQGIRLAHPALYAGWIALSAYLGVYLPVFIGLTRIAVHRLKISLVVAAPLIWVGLELLRGHLITGFSMGLLAHTQADFPRLIQISDIAGGYTLSFLIMLVAGCLARTLGGGVSRSVIRLEQPSICWWPVLPAAIALATTLLYGHYRVVQQPPGTKGPTAQVALIQGSLDTEFVELSTERMSEIFAHYRGLTSQAVAAKKNLDLVVWPESSFVYSETLVNQPLDKLPGVPLSPEELQSRLAAAQDSFRSILAAEARNANANTDADRDTLLVVGATTFAHGNSGTRTYNSALLANRTGEVTGRYYKTHPVMFGEYIPFAAALPWLYRITPMSGGLTPGDGPSVFEVAGLKMSPSVCFESTIPHLIRGQLRELARRGMPADVLLNITNDGWFWGSSMLDLHFRCGVFRAVENRKPAIVAANTGISTWVDGNGVVRQRGARRQAGALFAEVQADGRCPLYHRLGDAPAWICAVFCLAMAGAGWRQRPREADAIVPQSP